MGENEKKKKNCEYRNKCIFKFVKNIELIEATLKAWVDTYHFDLQIKRKKKKRQVN